MVGVMLMAASKRHLLMVDGLPACAALMLAARIAPPVTDYCVFCRSHGHLGLDQALNLFRASALLELGLDSMDGTGAALAWPLVQQRRRAAHRSGRRRGPRSVAPARPGRRRRARRAAVEPVLTGGRAYNVGKALPPAGDAGGGSASSGCGCAGPPGTAAPNGGLKFGATGDGGGGAGGLRSGSAPVAAATGGGISSEMFATPSRGPSETPRGRTCCSTRSPSTCAPMR